MRGRALTILLMCGAAACQPELPSQFFIDKLRVLAVRAEPAEVPPGGATAFDVLAVEPIVGATNALSSLWLACQAPEGVATPLPCGVAEGSFGKDPAAPVLPPRCDEISTLDTCIIGQGVTASYRVPNGITLSEEGVAQVFITSVVSNAGSALDCLVGTSFNTMRPVDPDHCVISVKRLPVSNNPPNRNPTLLDLSLTAIGGDPVSLLAGDATYAIAPAKGDRPELSLHVTRGADAAEMKDDATYEELAATWFVTGGKMNGGRSRFQPTNCTTDRCEGDVPTETSQATWVAPTEAELMNVTDARGLVRFWTVVRDDRGGVAWLSGSADVN